MSGSPAPDPRPPSPHARRVPQPSGGADRLGAPLEALVVGGGLAGCAAATVLAERGASVRLLEAAPRLGGRLAAWEETLADGSTVRMERGFHAFFRQYYNLRALLRRVDPGLRRLRPLEDYPVLGPGGAVQSFEALPTRVPWNLAALVRRAETLGLRDLLRVDAGAALEMLRYDSVRTYERFDGVTAGAYLDSLRFPPAARRMLFDVFSHSFFNPEEEMSAAELLMMFHFYFLGNREGLVFDVLDEPFDVALWEPLLRRLEAHGAEVRTNARVLRLRGGKGERWRAEIETDAGDEEVAADAVVLALPVAPLREVVEASPDLGDPAWRHRVGSLRLTLPFAVWRLWLDRPVAPYRHPFAGTAGFPHLDNISVYERVEGESRRWAGRTGGGVVELHAYAVPEDTPETELRRALLAGLHELYPETREAGVVDERWLLRRDCPAFPPGGHATRPIVRTPDPTLALAGDFVRMPFPSALMERAAASGFAAASAVLAPHGVRPEPLWSVPPRGPLAPRRRKTSAPYRTSPFRSA